MANTIKKYRKNTEAYRVLKNMVSKLRNIGNDYSFVIVADGFSGCNVSVLSDSNSGAQQHVISMRCSLPVQQAQALVSQYA